MKEAVAQLTALVTGAATGIGKAVSIALIERGYRVLMTDRDEELGAAMAAAVGADFLPLDVADESAWFTVESHVSKEYSGLDVLVNNAGIYVAGTIEDASIADWERVQRVNVIGVLLGCQYAIRSMRERGGSIINISSGAALRPKSSAAVYSATKSAVWNLTRSTALHCAEQQYNIRCNSVHPGMVDTQMVAGRVSDDAARASLYAQGHAVHPLGRMASTADIAAAVVFLASPESSYLTGVALPVDGGYAIG